ncbi:hypothetical protein LTR17_019958 [Elasticomyces elasticus]|nr:hypothetical protein LTR17_019958 [Elasticomyces elasticus]
MVEVLIEDAKNLCQDALRALGYSCDELTIISDDLLDAQLQGYPFAGLARTLSIIETVQSHAKSVARSIKVTRSGPAFAHINGGDSVGYLVAYEATATAIEKAKQVGVSLVSANEFFYSGNLSYYAEMAAKEGLITLITSNGSPIVVPYGGLFAQAVLAQRLGTELPEGVAFDSSGHPTTDPSQVLDGTLAAWGEFKGSGLAMMVQLLGFAAGSSEPVPFMSNFGFLIIAFDPDILQLRDQIEQNADRFAESIRATNMLPGYAPARLPFERSMDVDSKQKQEARWMWRRGWFSS